MNTIDLKKKLEELDKTEAEFMKTMQARKNAIADKRKSLEESLKKQVKKQENFAKYIVGGYVFAHSKDYLLKELKDGHFTDKEKKAICEYLEIDVAKFIQQPEQNEADENPAEATDEPSEEPSEEQDEEELF